MEIRIGKSAAACVTCGRDFQHEEEMRSLVRVLDDAFEREDHCMECWQSDGDSDAYSVWSPRFYDPKVADQEPPEVFSPLRQIFYESVESDERIQLAKAYLAAQLLRRQKVFRLIKESGDTEDEIQVTLFYDRIGNRLVEVRDPNLTHAELEEGRHILMERLNELEAPEDSDEEEAEEGPETVEPTEN